jgi:predicted membrane channel-forming protein YqfA (hemolysin III family)
VKIRFQSLLSHSTWPATAWRIDYVGIAVLIVASFYPVVYYSFYCVPVGLCTS